MKTIWKRAGVAAGALTLGVGIYAAASHHAAESLRGKLLAATALTGAKASLDRVSVNPLTGSVAIYGMRLTRGDATTARIGRIARKGAGWSPVTSAFAQSAHTFELDDVEISGKLGTISADEIRVEDASLSEDAFSDLLDSDTAADLIAGLKGLSFKSLRTPELVFEMKLPDGESRQVFRDVALEGMRNGRLARLAAASGEVESKAPKGPVTKGSHGLYEANGLDFVLMSRFFADKAAPGEALATAYESFRVDNFKIGVQGLFEYSIGRVESGAVRMKPLPIALADLIAKMPANGQPKLPPAEVKVLLPALLEIYNSFSDDGFAISDVKVSVPAAPGSGGSIARMSGSFGGGKAPAGFKIEGVTAAGPGFSAKLGALGMEGFSLRPTLQAAIKAINAGDTDLKRVDPRDLIPKIGTYTLRNLEFEGPDPKPPRGQQPGRLSGGVQLIEIAAKNEIKGIPTDISMVYDRVTLRVPPNTADDGLKNLIALGYSAIDVSSSTKLQWNEAKKEVALTEMTLNGVNMGSARLTGVLGNIGREVFEAELPMMQVAALGATAKALSLKIENTGLAERLFEMQAKQQGRKADEVRAEMGSMAALGIPALLGPSDDAKALANAIGRFLARPKSLTLEATAKNAGGVGIPDMATLTNPQQALTLINLKASAD